MDLQSFCVGNRKKVHSFQFLRSAVQSTEKMPKSFQFAVPVNGPIMEESCFKNISNVSCNAQFSFSGVTKPQECPSKRSCFDHFNKFSHFTFSRVVGGFVGSKSQGGSASREPHQVWDVIFRQLVDTTCEATVNNNAQQYFSIGEAVSQSIFGQFNNRNNSTLDFTSFIFTGPGDIFTNKKPPGKMPSTNDHCEFSVRAATDDTHVKLSEVPCDIQLPSFIVEKKVNTNNTEIQLSSKQSYADVAKTSVPTKPESMYKADKYQTIAAAMSLKKAPEGPQYSRRNNKRYMKKGKQNGNCYNQPSFNHSSQIQLHRRLLLNDKGEEPIPSKFSRDRVHLRNSKLENTSFSKMKTKEVNCTKSVSPIKESKSPENKKHRNNKYKYPNMREKERKNIDLQVHEDMIFDCNMPEELCQNWRCDHNRSRAEFGNRRNHFGTKGFKLQTRLHSPPPRTLKQDCIKNVKPKPEDNCHKNQINGISKIEDLHEETLCNNETSTICGSLNLSRSGDNNESSLSSSPTTPTVVLPLRCRVSSECSVDSEDSSVVFERDEQDVDETGSDQELGSDSGSNYSSECESEEEDCDEVDFCYIIPPKDLCTNAVSAYADAFSPVPDRLKDINARWFKENALLPKEEKVPEKVHFPIAAKLAKVHHMIHWPFAYREARRGHWEEIGRDHYRFQLRIQRAEQELSHILDPEHRRKIWDERMCDVGST